MRLLLAEVRILQLPIGNNMLTRKILKVLCGLGGIGQYVGVLSIVSLLTTEQERPTYFGLCSMVGIA